VTRVTTGHSVCDEQPHQRHHGCRQQPLASGNSRRRHCRGQITDIDRRDEPIALTGDCLDVPRRLCVVDEHLAELADAVVEAAVEIDVHVLSPDCGMKIRPKNERPGAGDEARERSGRLALQRDGHTVTPKFTGGQIEVIGAKTAARALVHEGLDDVMATRFGVTLVLARAGVVASKRGHVSDLWYRPTRRLFHLIVQNRPDFDIGH
jgi:hypothetical protein